MRTVVEAMAPKDVAMRDLRKARESCAMLGCIGCARSILSRPACVEFLVVSFRAK